MCTYILQRTSESRSYRTPLGMSLKQYLIRLAVINLYKELSELSTKSKMRKRGFILNTISNSKLKQYKSYCNIFNTQGTSSIPNITISFFLRNKPQWTCKKPSLTGDLWAFVIRDHPSSWPANYSGLRRNAVTTNVKITQWRN